MLIESKSFAKTVGIQVDSSPPVKGRVGVVDDAVMVGAEDELVSGVIIEASDKIIDMVGLCDMGAVFFADFPNGSALPASSWGIPCFPEEFLNEDYALFSYSFE